MWTDRVLHTVLDNGVTVLVHRDASAPVLSVVTHMRAGYLNEPDPWVGISHVLEHMYFKYGTLADDVQRMGGYVNAGTIYDKTVYYSVVPSAPQALKTTVELHAKALTDLDVDADELARELEVIIQEANRKKDTPTAVTIETLYAKLFAQHRIRRWRIGTEDVLRQFGRDDLMGFYHRYYTPRRTIVAVVGDIDVTEAVEIVAREFGPWSAQEGTQDPEPVESAPPPPTFTELHGDVNRSVSAMGWRTTGGLTADVAALDMAAATLGAGKGSVLGREIRDPGLSSSVAAHHYTLADVGIFDLFLEGAAAHADEAVERSVAIVDSITRRGVDPDDLQCAKSLASARWSRRIETTDGFASMLCEFEALGGYAKLDSWFQTVMDVTPEQLHNASARWLKPGEASAVRFAPHGSESVFAPDSWPRQVDSWSVRPAPIPEYQTKAVRQGRASQQQVGNGVLHVQSSGADILAMEKTGTGLAFLGVYADTLRADEPREQAGISSLLLRTSLRGAGGLSASQLSRLAESLGGAVTSQMMLGWVGWGVSVRIGDLASAANLLQEVAADPALDSTAFETERQLQISDAARGRDDMTGYPMRRLLEHGLPTSWYGSPVIGEPETLESITLDDLRGWADTLRARRLTVIVVGDAPAEELVERVAVFGGWPSAKRINREMPPFAWTPYRGDEPRDKAQSAIAMAFPAGTYRSDDRFPLAVASSILSGLAGRLFVELRDELSLAYSVSASPWFRSRAGALLTYIATSPRREDEAREQMLHSLVRFRDEGFSEDELIRARNYAAGQLQLRRQSSYAIASDVASAWLYGDLDELDDMPSRFRSVTESDVRNVAHRVIIPDTRAEFTLRGGSKGA